MQLGETVFAEAERQLNICNACRYCEGYCAVFPALTRRINLTEEDITHLANLCHDCRDCYYACMYIPPHEFALNLPEILAKARQQVYREVRVSIAKPTRRTEHRGTKLAAAFAIVSGVVVVLSSLTIGLSKIVGAHPRAASPYSVISYPALLGVSLAAFVFGLAVMIDAALRYARRSRCSIDVTQSLGALAKALRFGAELHYLGGGGAGCTYPDEQPSAARRVFHSAVAFGFVLCLSATIAAGVLQDIVGHQPPYSLLSVPVIFGTIGGVGLVLGSIGLIVLKHRADARVVAPAGALEDYGFIVALLILGLTGLLALSLRRTPAYGVVLIVHLAAVLSCFVVAPYTRFVHFVYRLQAIVKDNLEDEAEQRATAV